MTEMPAAPFLPAHSSPTPKNRWKLPAIVGGAAVVVLIVAGVVFATSSSGSGKMSVTGTLELKSSDGGVTVNDNGCTGASGYSDIAPGAEVIVADSAGKTLAIGNLLETKLADSETCIFGWTVDNVPSGKKFYSIEVTHRGFVQYTEAQMKAAPALTLGS